jgi:hypothetical protein
MHLRNSCTTYKRFSAAYSTPAAAGSMVRMIRVMTLPDNFKLVIKYECRYVRDENVKKDSSRGWKSVCCIAQALKLCDVIACNPGKRMLTQNGTVIVC